MKVLSYVALGEMDRLQDSMYVMFVLNKIMYVYTEKDKSGGSISKMQKK